LEWLYVTPQWRRKGVTSELLRRLAAAWFQQQHASRVCVNVAASNATAHSFYARHGAEVMNQHWLVWNNIATLLERPRD
jgi:GNAT superfamily N-acetyltransferase